MLLELKVSGYGMNGGMALDMLLANSQYSDSERPMHISPILNLS